ncbi:MAG: hypothetical protein WCZ86_02510 [Desulfurivibrionaceae bacterium]
MMDKKNGKQDPDEKIIEGIIADLARQLQLEPESIRSFLMRTYREIWTEAVVKDFVSIFAMRIARDKFSVGGAKTGGYFK